MLPRFGLTFAEYDVVVSLRRAGKPYRMKPHELTRALLMSTGGTSNVVNHLVAAGLVERDPDPDDRRSSWVQLTRAGVDIAEQVVRATSAAHAEVFAGVPADARKPRPAHCATCRRNSTPTSGPPARAAREAAADTRTPARPVRLEVDVQGSPPDESRGEKAT